MVIKFELPFNTRRSASDISNAFNAIKPNLVSIQGQKDRTAVSALITELKTTSGLEKVSPSGLGLSVEDGKLLFSTEKELGSLRISLKNAKTSAIDKDVYISNGVVKDARGFSDSAAVGSFLESVFEQLDFPLLKLRRVLRPENYLKLFAKYFSKNKLSEDNSRIAAEIKTLFRNIDERIQSVDNVPSRSKIKNGYPLIQTGIRGTKQLDFKEIDGVSYSVNVVVDRKAVENIVIRFTDKSNGPRNIIIEPDGQVLKHKNIGRKSNYGEREYYLQEELDAPEFQKTLTVLRDELVKYDKYLEQSIENRNFTKAKYSTNGIGLLKISTEKSAEKIKHQYEILRKAMLSLKETDEKESAKKKLGIFTKAGSPSILFKDIKSDEIAAIHLSFPPTKGKTGMKIITLDENENILDSLFVLNSTLVKFKAQNLIRSVRSDTKTNYYSQSEVNSSRLDEYLGLLQERFDGIMELIQSGKKDWYK